MSDHQLTSEERYQIYGLHKGGFTQKAIAENVGVHPATISRELRRNRGEGVVSSKRIVCASNHRECGQGHKGALLALVERVLTILSTTAPNSSGMKKWPKN